MEKVPEPGLRCRKHSLTNSSRLTFFCLPKDVGVVQL